MLWLESMQYFDNMQVLIFCKFGLKMPFYAVKMWVTVVFDSLIGIGLIETPIMHLFAWKRHVPYKSLKSFPQVLAGHSPNNKEKL